MTQDARRRAPAAARNRDPILEVLREALPPRGLVLEIACGSGEHALHFARHLPHLDWQPSDPDPGAVASAAAWREAEGSPNLRAPLRLDVRETPWPIDRADAVFCANMIHIAPWAAAEALVAGAARLLPEGANLVLYGPFHRHGAPTAPSNAAFDADLQRRDPAWGIRDLEGEVAPLLARMGFGPPAIHPMPANNLTVVARRLSGR